jgi:hypothetical protein
MENDTTQDIELDINLDDEQDSSSEINESATDEGSVDYKAKTEELEREMRKLKRKLHVKQPSTTLPTKPNQEPLPSDIVQKVQKLDLLEQKRQFGYEHGLSPEETDWIFQSTGGKPTKEALEIPFIKHGLEGYRASKRVEANTPGASGRSSVFGNKDFTELSADDRAKAFADRVKSIRK